MDELERALELLNEAHEHLKKIPGYIMADSHNRRGLAVMIRPKDFKEMFTDWDTFPDYYEDGMDKLRKRINGVTVYCVEDRRAK